MDELWRYLSSESREFIGSKKQDESIEAKMLAEAKALFAKGNPKGGKQLGRILLHYKRSKTFLSLAAIPTCLATWIAVSGASPVAMATEWSASMRAPMTVAESALVLHSKAINPANFMPLSTAERDHS